MGRKGDGLNPQTKEGKGRKVKVSKIKLQNISIWYTLIGLIDTSNQTDVVMLNRCELLKEGFNNLNSKLRTN